jgi:trimethylamine--corrinoid protein Co-methyltransferase
MFRKEHFIPSLLDRSSRDAWEKAGAKDIVRAARERARWILKNHEPEPMEKGTVADIERFIKDVTKGYASEPARQAK